MDVKLVEKERQKKNNHNMSKILTTPTLHLLTYTYYS